MKKEEIKYYCKDCRHLIITDNADYCDILAEEISADDESCDWFEELYDKL